MNATKSVASIPAAIASILARLCLSAIFLSSAVGNKIPQFNNVVAAMTAEGVPRPQIALVGAIVFLIVGSLSLIAGYKARLGAFLLLIFLVAATYFFHDFWTFDGEEKQEQMIQFMKNLALCGAMLFVIANGSGAGSYDNRKPSTKKSKGDF